MPARNFSPDGTRIAYSARVSGAMDVFVIEAGGGVPKRLTWNPAGNRAAGWSPDGILRRRGPSRPLLK